MSGAGPALQAAAIEALGGLSGLGVYEAPPVQAAVPYAVVETSPEADWSHKSGAGRELRLAVTLHDRGERPMRLRGVMEQVEEELAAIEAEFDGWQLVSFRFLRGRLAPPQTPEPNGLWTGLVEFRARLLRSA